MHDTTLDQFWIDRFEVIIAQYDEVMQQCIGSGQCANLDWISEIDSRLTDDVRKPRTGVTWFDAQRFCLSREARLPTEEEWEYAAAGAAKNIFPWGNEFNDKYVVYGQGTHIVGSINNVSWVGAFDMAGNAAEWVEDRFKPYITGSNWWPKSGASDTDHVLRGGAWDEGSITSTTYYRNYSHPQVSDRSVGFRCATSRMVVK